jgi:hypothetical protein
MPSVIDTPARVEYEAYAVYEAQSPVREAHPGFWHRVLQYVKRQRVHTPHGTPSTSYGPLRRIETPADLLAREYPALYIQACAGV